MSFIIAMEDAENATPETNEVVAAQTETEVIRDNAEVEAAVGEVTGEVAEAVSGIEDADELVDIQEQATDAIERGDGLSEDAAAMATIAIERIHHRLYGSARKQSIVPAKESFGHSSTRLASTIIVKESITEVLTDFWRAMVTFAKRVWEKIKLIVEKITGSTKLAEKNILSLRARVDAMPSTHEKKVEVMKGGSLIKSLSLGDGKMNAASAKEIAGNSEKLMALSSAMGTATADFVAWLTLSLREPDHEKLINGVSSYVKEALSLPRTKGLTEAKGIKYLASGSTSIFGQQIKADLYGPFVHSKVLGFAEHEKDGKKIFTVNLVSGKADVDAKEAEVLSVDEMKELLDLALTLNKKVADYDKVSKFYKATTESISDLGGKIVAELTKVSKGSDNKELTTVAKDAQKTVNVALRCSSVFGNQAPGVMSSTVTALSNYVSASLNNYAQKK